MHTRASADSRSFSWARSLPVTWLGCGRDDPGSSPSSATGSRTRSERAFRSQIGVYPCAPFFSSRVPGGDTLCTEGAVRTYLRRDDESRLTAWSCRTSNTSWSVARKKNRPAVTAAPMPSRRAIFHLPNNFLRTSSVRAKSDDRHLRVGGGTRANA